MQSYKFSLRLMFATGFCAAAVASNAQAPAGPMAQTQASPPAASSSSSAPAQPKPDVPRTKNLAGSWKLNKDESTQPKKRDDDSNGRRGGRSGGGWPGGGGGRGGYGGGGMHRGMSDDERKEMQELMRPSETLEFTQDGAAVKMTDDYDRNRTFYTDGRKIKKSKDTDSQEYDATWQDYRLVSDFKDPDGNKVERTFEVLEGNEQLRETIHFTVGKSQREVYLRYVYDLKSGGNSAGN